MNSQEFGKICDAVSPMLLPEYSALDLDHAITPLIEEFVEARLNAQAEPLDEDTLLADLKVAANANQHGRPCQVCEALRSMSESARAGVKSALAGTIGERTLAEILTRNGYPTGRRAVATHRREDHKP